MSTTNTLQRFLWQVGATDPRYRNFLKAQNIEATIGKFTSNLYDELINYHGDRINKYEYFWQLYFGNHWFVQSEENIDPVKINYMAVTVNKNVAFLMNKGFKVTSPFPEVESFLQSNWDLNNAKKEANAFGTALATQGGITGDAFFDIKLAVHEDYNTEYIKFDVLDSNKCFPVLDKNKIRGLLYYGKETRVNKENFGFAEYRDEYEGTYYNNSGRKLHLREEKVVGEEEFAMNQMPLITHNVNYLYHLPKAKQIMCSYYYLTHFQIYF
jgi:hypothetical protein